MRNRIAAAEEALALGVPFGDHDVMSARLAEVYLDLLRTIADHVAGARLLLDAVIATGNRRLLGDPLLRRTIEDGVGSLLLGHDGVDHCTIDDLLSAAASTRAGLLEGRAGQVRIGGAAHHGSLWVQPEADEPADRHFLAQCRRRLHGLSFVAPVEEQTHNIIGGARLLDDLLPLLSRSALAHTRIVCVATSTWGFKSLTVLGLPGTIVLSPAVLATPERAAEALLHESMHLKLMDVDYVEPLFTPGFLPQESARVVPPWHDDGRHPGWPLDRLLTAMHVYTTLTVFFAEAERQAVAVPDAEAKYEQAFRRAAFLARKAEEFPDTFSANGMRFVEWIGGILRGIDSRTIGRSPERLLAATR